MEETTSSVIWIIDAEQWPRAMLRAELIERGYDAVGYATARDAIESYLDRKPDAIFVELRGQPMDLVARLLHAGVPVLVAGGAVELHDLPDGKWAAVMRRPVSLGEIANAIASAAPPDSRA